MKKILIVSPFFEEDYSYQEVQIADTLNEMGHKVVVLTTDRSFFIKDKSYRVPPSKKEYKVIRIKDIIRISDTIYPLENSKLLLQNIDYDIALIIYPSHGFGYYVLKNIPRNKKIITFFQDHYNVDYVKLKYRLIKKLIKNKWYIESFKRSNIVAAITPVTIDWFQNNVVFKKHLEGKLKLIGLGFNSDLFYHDFDLGAELRRKFNISQDKIVLVTITRAIKSKPILEWIKPILSAMEENEKLVYVFAGLSNNEYSNQIRHSLVKHKLFGRIILLDLQNANEMNRLYNMADYGIWFDSASISIQQGMGTGVSVILPKLKVYSHLINEDINGMYYDNLTLTSLLINLKKNNNNREGVAHYNQKYSYYNIVSDLLISLQN